MLNFIFLFCFQGTAFHLVYFRFKTTISKSVLLHQFKSIFKTQLLLLNTKIECTMYMQLNVNGIWI